MQSNAFAPEDFGYSLSGCGYLPARQIPRQMTHSTQFSLVEVRLQMKLAASWTLSDGWRKIEVVFTGHPMQIQSENTRFNDFLRLTTFVFRHSSAIHCIWEPLSYPGPPG